MEIIDLSKLVEIIGQQEDKDWHFHFLTPVCFFNDSGKYKIILETKEKSYSAISDSKPTKELERIENLFYKR